MKKWNIIAILISVIIYLASCEEVYNPDDLSADKKIPVIEAFMTTDSANYNVKITWAALYTSVYASAIKGAKVIISDDEGNSETLKEVATGNFSTSKNLIFGKIGHTYKLHVELPNGQIIESTPETIPGFSYVDSIYAEIGSQIAISKNTFGDVVTTTSPGLNVYTDIRVISNNAAFFRMTIDVATELERLQGTNMPFPYVRYKVNSSEIYNSPNVAASIVDGSSQIIKANNLGFLLCEIIPPAPNEANVTNYFVVGWAVTTNFYSITPGAYKFYQSIITQLDAKQRMFDPIPSQIKGNLKCINDSTQIVLGYFEVASRQSRQDLFYWAEGQHQYKQKRLIPMVTYPVDSIRDSIPPGYWRIFNN